MLDHRTIVEGKLDPKVKSGRSSRFIVLHAGGVYGFVPGCLLMFESPNGKGDHHNSMNLRKFPGMIPEPVASQHPALLNNHYGQHLPLQDCK